MKRKLVTLAFCAQDACPEFALAGSAFCKKHQLDSPDKKGSWRQEKQASWKVRQLQNSIAAEFEEPGQ